MVRGWVPFLGCALPFGRDAPAFLRRCQQRHGDAFTIHLMGRRLTFLLDPRDFPKVLTRARALSFDPIAREISTRAFGYRTLYTSGVTQEQMRRTYHQHLRPGVMQPLAERTQQELSASLGRCLAALEPGADGWSHTELFELVARCVFQAGTTALFGEGAGDEPSRRRFMAFDAQFARLVAGVPLRLLGTARQDRQRLIEQLSTPWPAASAFIQERHALLRDYIDDVEIARVHLSMLWASQANTIPAAFWAVALLLEQPQAVAAVQAEIDGLVERDDHGAARFETGTLRKMRVLDSVIFESLRLCSGANTIRTVLEPVTLTVASGQRFTLRRGDYVCMFPYLSHRDPEVFEEPEQFRFDRFYCARGSKQFHKQGERLGFALMPFGGGETMCPGRFLALAEIKMLVTMLLVDYRVERLAGQARPSFDFSRSGLGILPPVEPLMVRLRPRGRNEA